jgi:outer membrane protein TolC
MSKKILTVILMFTLASSGVQAQLSLDACQEKARANYPLIKRMKLIEQTSAFNLENTAKGYLPQVSFSARATYQSEVTEMPINLPNVSIESLSLDQYQAVAEVNQTIWDGGVIQSQQKITEANAGFEKQKLETELYALRERVNQLFFGILLIGEQLKQNDILQEELKTNLERVKAYVVNGVANQPDVDAIRVELLNSAQRRTEMIALRKAYGEMLSAMTGEPVTEGTTLVKPLPAMPADYTLKSRPEMKMFDAQSGLLDGQTSLIDARNRPRIGAFVQGGYGKPGLNMLKNEFSPYYIGGIRLSWNLSNLYTKKNDYQLVALSKSGVEVQKEAFLYNSSLQMTQQRNEVEKYRQLIENDDEIIRLRSNIKQSAEAKVANGTLTVSDLVREINAENLARQNKALHETQLLISIYNLKNTVNQ